MGLASRPSAIAAVPAAPTSSSADARTATAARRRSGAAARAPATAVGWEAQGVRSRRAGVQGGRRRRPRSGGSPCYRAAGVGRAPGGLQRVHSRWGAAAVGYLAGAGLGALRHLPPAQCAIPSMPRRRSRLTNGAGQRRAAAQAQSASGNADGLHRADNERSGLRWGGECGRAAQFACHCPDGAGAAWLAERPQRRRASRATFSLSCDILHSCCAWPGRCWHADRQKVYTTNSSLHRSSPHARCCAHLLPAAAASGGGRGGSGSRPRSPHAMNASRASAVATVAPQAPMKQPVAPMPRFRVRSVRRPASVLEPASARPAGVRPNKTMGLEVGQCTGPHCLLTAGEKSKRTLGATAKTPQQQGAPSARSVIAQTVPDTRPSPGSGWEGTTLAIMPNSTPCAAVEGGGWRQERKPAEAAPRWQQRPRQQAGGSDVQRACSWEAPAP